MATVVAPGFLANPEILRWLNGVMPAWTMLDFGSFNALHEEPSAGNKAIRLDANLPEINLAGSAVARTARILLRRATEDGLTLTATGNLSRRVVAEMIDVIEWPGFDTDELFQFHKVVNEPDFLPVHFVRVLLQGTKLLRVQGGKLAPTRLGNKMYAPERCGSLQALLVHIAMWHLNLGYFDRNPVQSWPQNDIGVVLWSLSASANDWMHPDKLTRLCTIPVIALLEAAWDLSSFAMESRVLRPLTWFGLLEWRWEANPGLGEPRLYRKTSLFDHFIKFQVQVERAAVRH